jgi:uncharacterized protein
MIFKIPPKSVALGETYNLTTVPIQNMKLQPDKFDAPSITAYGPGWIGLLGEQITRSVVIGSRGEKIEWGCDRFNELTPAHFNQLAELGPELVLFGSGQHLRFPQPAWLAGLAQRRIGLETMDTAAACRTYNILAGEGRHVVAALLLETP